MLLHYKALGCKPYALNKKAFGKITHNSLTHHSKNANRPKQKPEATKIL